MKLKGEIMSDIKIKVNGDEIILSEFPSEILISTICGMLKPLKGVDEIKDIEIKIKK